jgi:hypothetical protein
MGIILKYEILLKLQSIKNSLQTVKSRQIQNDSTKSKHTQV